MKTLLILYPYKFTEFDYYKHELAYFNKKNYKIIIHDLSKILINEKFHKTWINTKREKKAISFSSFLSWKNEFNKVARDKNVLVYDFLDYSQINFTVFLIKLILMLSKLPVLKYDVLDVPVIFPVKNLKFFLHRIFFRHKFNLKVYFSKINQLCFSRLIKFIKFDQIFLMRIKNFYLDKTKKNTYLVKCHSSDYSNFLLERYNNSNKSVKKKYIIYIDRPVPYFSGDYLSEHRKVPENNIEKWYYELNSFFDYLEDIFKSQVLIIPHPKQKDPSLKRKNKNPYFSNRISDNSYNACAKLIPKCLFVISLGSSALSYAAINYKPIQFIYSSNYIYGWSEKEDLFFQANLLGLKPINIASFKKKKLSENLRINRAKYDRYKPKFLTYKNSNISKSNYKIIKELMDRRIEKR